jgi:hypothetical protein
MNLGSVHCRFAVPHTLISSHFIYALDAVSLVEVNQAIKSLVILDQIKIR